MKREQDSRDGTNAIEAIGCEKNEYFTHQNAKKKREFT
jgi:hypothetical protein